MNIREQSVRCMAERQMKFEEILKKAENKHKQVDKNRRQTFKQLVSTLGDKTAEAEQKREKVKKEKANRDWKAYNEYK